MKTLGLIGCGKMGSALLKGILLCVKPADLLTLLSTLTAPDPTRLFISIAAGVKTSAMENSLTGPQRVIRVMPNTPSLINQAASAFSLGTHATQQDADFTREVLTAVGIVEEVPEKLLDAVTGLSGSGPAYVYTVIEALSDGGVLMGLPKDKAIKLAAQTVAGAAQMVLDSGLHPAQLRDQVTSPGGTTIAGLHALETGGLRAAFIDAVKAATDRSIELGKS
jgi:pyrroline-5-carboxylate reductase